MTTCAESDARLEFRLPAQTKQEIERAAAAQNRSVTDFATSALVEAARRVLAEHAEYEHVRLSNRDRDRFLAMLDSDPRRTRPCGRPPSAIVSALSDWTSWVSPCFGTFIALIPR